MKAGNLHEGIRLYRLKRWQLALEELLRVDASRFMPEESLNLAYFLGLCYAKLQRYDEALLYLEQVVTTGTDPLRVYQCRLTLAFIYSITGRTKLAEFELKQLEDAGYESTHVLNTTAYTAWYEGDFDKALDYYQRTLDFDPGNTTALNGLGYILVDTGRDAVRGLYYCKQAVEKKPQSPAYLDSLGWAYFKNNFHEEAKNWLRKAYELAPDEEEIRKHMRIVLGESA
jgi:tetratricopeptide (TPR) repeat protein